jgi:hypothetical protein
VIVGSSSKISVFKYATALEQKLLSFSITAVLSSSDAELGSPQKRSGLGNDTPDGRLQNVVAVRDADDRLVAGDDTHNNLAVLCCIRRFAPAADTTLGPRTGGSSRRALTEHGAL